MKKLILAALCLFHFADCLAYNRQFGMSNARFTADGTIGGIGGREFADYAVRAQMSRMLSNRWTVGGIASYDQLAFQAGQFARDAFAYVETGYGRLEAGWTESIASKLALRLPDVGGLRLNNNSFVYDSDFSGITNPTVRGNQYAWRGNYASMPNKAFQFGFSQTIRGASFKSSSDIGIRYRNHYGAIKTSFSIGGSYIEAPSGLIGDNFLAPTTARARYQGTFGFNWQSGSLVWAATLKAVVDDSPIGGATDGLQAGTGLSYDFLSASASANYIFSSVGTWGGGGDMAHTAVLSLRYKASRFFNIWTSGGVVAPSSGVRHFLTAAGLSASF
ncbi:MAG: hypothetical protein LBB08_00150 [Rickettsiales bacterium]|jgi:hypothetical protein|nr:hypothetical protein [Rickettsiales bacterium]